MNQDIVLKGARLVLHNEVINGTVAIAGGKIFAVDQGTTSITACTDLDGDLLIPGLVELHTDNLERHLMPRPKVNWSELPALLAHDAELAAAGITTVFDSLGVGDADEDQLRSTNWSDVLQSMSFAKQNNLLRSEHRLHVRCELAAANTIELFAPFFGHTDVSLLSLMDHTLGQRQWENIEMARIYYTGKKGWSPERFDRQVAQSVALQDKHMAPNRQFFVEHCDVYNITMASHDDTTTAHVDQAKTEGVSIAEFPTTLAAAQRARELNLNIIMGAPNVVRGGSHSGNISARELAKHHLVDTLSSDYIPSSLLMAAFTLANHEIYSLSDAISTVSRNPALSVGLIDRGSIEHGLRADLVQVRLIDGHNRTKIPVVRAVWKEGIRIF